MFFIVVANTEEYYSIIMWIVLWGML